MKHRLFIVRILFIVVTTGFLLPAKANDSLLMHKLVQRLAVQQQKVNGKYLPGMFPSYREYQWHARVFKDDDNVFFTGLVVFTLRQLRNELPEADRLLCDTIISRAAPVYQHFRNRKGRDTYAFWQTDTPTVFPNGGWLNWMDKMNTLPNDMDDTSIVLLANDAPDSVVKAVHALMQRYTNTGKRKIKNTYKAYKNIPAYSTWFGDKWAIDFDVCVLSNILYLVQLYQLPFTAADSASLELVRQVVMRRQYLDKAAYVAPHYNRSPVILYHLSRLMQVRPLPALEPYRAQLIADAQNLYAQSSNFIDKVILSTALMRWGVAAPAQELQTGVSLETYVEQNDFVFFIANMASMLPNPLKQWMGGAGVGRFMYFCPAYNNALLLEYLVWRQRTQHQQ